MTMMALAQGAVGLGQVIGGAFSSAKRPEYKMPEAVRQSLALAKMNVANPYSPGYSQAKAESDLTAANQLQAAQQQGNPMEAIQTIAGAQQKANRDLQMYNEQDQKSDVSNLQGELAKVAQAQDLMFQMNEFAPYQDKSQQSKNMIGGGLENLFGAGGQLAEMDLLGKIYGESPVGTPSGVSQSQKGWNYPMSYEEGAGIMDAMKIGSSSTIKSKKTGMVQYDSKPKGLTNSFWKTW
mgnify:FL=1